MLGIRTDEILITETIFSSLARTASFSGLES